MSLTGCSAKHFIKPDSGVYQSVLLLAESGGESVSSIIQPIGRIQFLADIAITASLLAGYQLGADLRS